MIRKELKVDPIGYISKHLEGVSLSFIEELYVINKCPNLFPYILRPSKLAERLYLFKCKNGSDIAIHKLTSEKLINKALKKNPALCEYLDMQKYHKSISKCVDTLSRNGQTFVLEGLMMRDDIHEDIARKIVFIEPRTIRHVVNMPSMYLNFDIEKFIFDTNPMLMAYFEKTTPEFVHYAIRKDISNIAHIPHLIGRANLAVVSEEVCKYLINTDSPNLLYVKMYIKNFPEIFENLIKQLYKNGFNKDTNFLVRYLLKKYNYLINDQLAAFIVDQSEVS